MPFLSAFVLQIINTYIHVCALPESHHILEWQILVKYALGPLRDCLPLTIFGTPSS